MEEMKLVDDYVNKLTKVENNVVVLDEDVVSSLIEQINNNIEFANNQNNKLREALLKAMQDNNIYSTKVGQFTISQVIPKNTITFDKEKFLLEESIDVCNAFTTINTTQVFDIEKFKVEQPEMYLKYCTNEDETIVDTNKLEKTLPNIFKKYSAEIVSTRKPTIAIKQSKK